LGEYILIGFRIKVTKQKGNIIDEIQRAGFRRVWDRGRVIRLEDLSLNAPTLTIVIDRLKVEEKDS